MNKLREIRVVKKISQYQMRILTGIHQSKISLMENGLVLPTEIEASKLAQALGVTPDELFPDREKPNT